MLFGVYAGVIPQTALELNGVLNSWSIMIFWLFLVSALVPGLVSLLVSSFFVQKRNLLHHDFQLLAGSGSGSGACLPSCLASCLFFLCSKKRVCSIMISCFLLVPALVPGLVSLLVSLLVSSFFAQKKEYVPS